jgi:hypothetical protein
VKNVDVYEQLFNAELKNEYVIKPNGFFTHLGVDVTKYVNGSPIMYYKGEKIGLKKYLKFREDKNGWFKNDGKSNKRENRRFVADFETTGEEQSKKEGKARMWAGCCMNMTNINEYVITNNIDDFMENVKQIKNGIVYYHNIKFDGSYLLNWFNDNNIEYVEADKGRRNTFTCHIANGLYYTITWFLSDKKGPKRGQDKITFIDSLKILPTSVKELGKSFKDRLGGIGKIDESQEFYDEFRSVGHEITEREEKYLLQDCRVMAVALDYMINELGHTKQTMAGNALADFEKRFNKDENNVISEYGLPEYNFLDHFPKLPMGELDENDNVDDKGNGWNTWILKAYRGGYTYTAPRYRGVIIGKGVVYDVNSLYPFIMYTKLLPYGRPIWFDGDYNKQSFGDRKDYPLFIQKVKVQFVVKDDYLPTIPDMTKGRKNADYLMHSHGEQTLYLTNVDLELLKKHHEIIGDIKYIGGYMFKGKRGIFKEYIEYWMKVKKDADRDHDDAMRMIAKLFLNSLYGKFSSKWFKPSSYPVFRNGVLGHSKTKDWKDMTIDEQDEAYNNQVKYPAIAVFITSYARQLTIESAQKNYDRFCYADTDSLHLEGIEPANDINIDLEKSGDLGLWKQESMFQWAKFIRSKTYIENVFGKMVWDEKEGKDKFKACNEDESTCTELHVTVAGMSKECHKHVTKENFGDYVEGTEMVSGNKGVYADNKRTKMYRGGLVVCTGLYVLRASGSNFTQAKKEVI